MSIIEEALRRVQDPIVSPPPVPVHSWPTSPPPASAPRAGTPASTPKVINIGTVLGLTAILVIGGASWIAWRFGRDQRPALRAAEPLPAQAPDRVRSVAALSGLVNRLARVAPEQMFRVSGVVEGGGDPYALINGEILRLGEVIDGATLLEITEGRIRLGRADGEEIVLSVPR